MFTRIGPTELLLVAVVALLVFGPKRLPEAGRALGKAIKEFRQVTKEIGESVGDDAEARSEDRSETKGAA